MRVPLSWLREYVDLGPDVTAREVAERLISAGLEVETVDHIGADVRGPLVVARVVAFEEEEHSNGKTIRWCRVDVGAEHNEPASDVLATGRSVVCGARNFVVGDLVVVSLPGAVLPGGFAIAARKTYGHVSDGMICSARELGTGEDKDGIIVLPADAGMPGGDAIELLSLREDVLDIAVTPDRGYALSIRGVAREVATAFDVGFRDPAALSVPDATGTDWPVELAAPDRCDRFVLRTVTGFDEEAHSPLWMQRRLHQAGMRPISLAVDITNYVMLELGQPLHAYDRQRLAGPMAVRLARPGEKLQTLDGTTRTLDADDLLITDDTGPIGIAGIMGGAATEIDDQTGDIVIEAAHFEPTTIARSARRHRLPSEASRRFERGVDDRLQEAAAERAVRLLCELGGAVSAGTATAADHAATSVAIDLDLDLPTRMVGRDYSHDEVERLLTAVGCQVAVRGRAARVIPPSWRPDLCIPADLVEEVARLHGYDAIPALLPKAAVGRGLTDSQRLVRRVGQVLAGAGFTEVLSYPFVSPTVHDAFGLAGDDLRRRALRLANPISEEEPELRTSLLPGLLSAVRRNVSRGHEDIAVFEVGLVFRPGPDAAMQVVRPGVQSRPSSEETAALDALLPGQPRQLAVAMTGNRELAGWWGEGREATWADAAEAARTVAAAVRVEIELRADRHPPWHPGRCAALLVGDLVVGHAGELHPRVLGELGLPARTVAMELDLDVLARHARLVAPGPDIRTFPVAKEDVALVVADTVSAGELAAALRDGAGELLEQVRLFDVYAGDQVGPGQRSLAFNLRFRADDRTLTVDEVSAARDAAVAEAQRRVGAVLRGS
ncbi:MAG TPA: phenylalanine--tRNA ligase subunit beta [Actinomycetes bacterium]|nr:phenylalanine--tRNA ligase subunit beta [Actinomycetes bacterium]